MKKKPSEKRSKLFGRPEALLVEESVAASASPAQADLELRPGRRRPRPLAEPAPEPPRPIRIDTTGGYGPLVADDDEEVLATEEDDGSSDDSSFSLALDDARAADEADTVLDIGVRPRPIPPGDSSSLRLQASVRPAARPAAARDEFDLGDLVETVRARPAPSPQDEEPPGEVMEFDAGVLDEGYESADSVFAQAAASRIPIAAPRSAPGPINEDLPGLRSDRTVTAPATAPPRRIEPTLAPAPDFFPDPSTSPKPLPPRRLPAPVPPARTEPSRTEPARVEPSRAEPYRPPPEYIRTPPPRPGPPHPATQRTTTMPSPASQRPAPPRAPEPAPLKRPVSVASTDGVALLGFGVLVGLMLSGGGLWAWSKLAPESAPLRLNAGQETPVEGDEAAPPSGADATTPDVATDAATVAAPTGASDDGVATPDGASPPGSTEPAPSATQPAPSATDPTAVPAGAATAGAPGATSATPTSPVTTTVAKPASVKEAALAPATKPTTARTAEPRATSTPANESGTPAPAQVGRIPASAASVVESGYLRVQSDTKCLVIVDGRQRGYAPDMGLLELPQGEHQLKCVVPGTGTSRSMTVRVDSGTLRAVQLTFTE